MKKNVKNATIFVGHYGSGKTEVAINYALKLKQEFDKVCIMDLDTVNPYFRTKDAKLILERAGVKVITPQFANSNVDVPSLPPEVQGIFADSETKFVLDIGGDDDGATVLGAYASRFRADMYDMFCVINKCRPLTKTPEEVLEYVASIERNSRLKVTGLVNNTNLAYETTSETVLNSMDYADKAARLTDKPLVMTVATKDVAKGITKEIENLFEIDIKIKHSWL